MIPAAPEPPPPSSPLPLVQQRGAKVLMWLAAAAMAVMGWSIVCSAPGIQWNPPRLSPSFAIAYGLPIYALRDSSQHLGWFYGPVFPLWYLPVTPWSNPTWALVAAAVWNVFTMIAPIVLVVRTALGRAVDSLVVGALTAVVMLFGSRATHLNFYFIHVDVVCIGFGLVACAMLQRAVAKAERWALHGAALSLVLAIWTKQVAVMLAPGMLAWLWRQGKRAELGRWTFLTIVYGAAVTGLICAKWGAAEVLFNTVLVHSRTPWQPEESLLLIQVGRLLAAGLVWVPAAALAWWQLRRGGPATTSPQPSLITLLLWVAACQLPLGLIAAMKAGGGINSVHAVSYAFVAGLIVFVRALKRPARSPRLAVLGCTVALAVPLGSGVSLALSAPVAWKVQRRQEEFVALAREKPNTMYFPWSPLATLIAERKIQPFDDALYCLAIAQMPVSIETVRRGLPPKPVIMYQEPTQSKFALRYFELTP